MPVFTAITTNTVIQLNAKSVQAATQALHGSGYELLSIVEAKVTENEER